MYTELSTQVRNYQQRFGQRASDAKFWSDYLKTHYLTGAKNGVVRAKLLGKTEGKAPVVSCRTEEGLKFPAGQ